MPNAADPHQHPIQEFIHARLDHIAHTATTATELPQVTPRYPAKKPPWEPERWKVDLWDVVTVNGASDPITIEPGPCGGTRSTAVAHHIAAHDPATVLADVAFKRNILATHTPYSTYRDGPACYGCSCTASTCWESEPVPFPCDQLRHLAAIWSDHPDYQQQWAVELQGSAA